ncbi:MAG: NUDIX hydrolase [Anaerolineaceae bacterium]
MTYEILGKEKMFSGHVFSIERVEIALPEGRARKYDLVNIQNAVTVLPLDAENNVLFVNQYRVGSNSLLLELPAGKIELNEEAQITADREIREEIGLSAKNMQLLGEFFVSPGYSTERMYAFLATGLYPAQLDPDEDEYINIVKVPIPEAMQMIQQGQIRDSKTLATFLLALPQLHII